MSIAEPSPSISKVHQPLASYADDNMSEVYFAGLRADGPSQNVPSKVRRLFERARLGSTFAEGDLVAIKTHFGEPGSTSFLRPQFVGAVVDMVRQGGGRPFLTDSNTLYLGGRSNAVDHLNAAVRHGYTYPVIDAPAIIADGLLGRDEVEVDVNLKHCRTVRFGTAAHQASSIMVVSHFKGHLMTGFGGALKNLGMGFGSRAGKLEMHKLAHPTVDQKACTGCGSCAESCPQSAIGVDEKASIHNEDCIGCGECWVACPSDAIGPQDPRSLIDIQERIVEYCYGILKDKKDKVGYVTFVVDVTPHCDCPGWSDLPVVPDIGILASLDPVAIDQAAADLVNNARGLEGTGLKHHHAPGEDKIGAMADVDWTAQLRYAEELGLGSRKYELIEL